MQDSHISGFKRLKLISTVRLTLFLVQLAFSPTSFVKTFSQFFTSYTEGQIIEKKNTANKTMKCWSCFKISQLSVLFPNPFPCLSAITISPLFLSPTTSSKWLPLLRTYIGITLIITRLPFMSKLHNRACKFLH